MKNQGNNNFQRYSAERKQFVFVSKPRLSIQQLDIKFNKQERKQILHRRKSQIDFRKLRKISQNHNQQQDSRIKLPTISKKNFQLEIQQMPNQQKNIKKINLKKQKRPVNFLHAKSVSLLKRSKSNFGNFQQQQQNSNQDAQDTIENNQILTVKLKQEQKCGSHTKIFYISDLNLESIQNKDQLTRRSLIQKLIIKRQEWEKQNVNSSKKYQAKFLKNYNLSFKQLSKQFQRPDEILSKKLQIIKKQKKVKALIPRQNKRAFFNNQNGYHLQGWEIKQQDDIFLVQQS